MALAEEKPAAPAGTAEPVTPAAPAEPVKPARVAAPTAPKPAAVPAQPATAPGTPEPLAAATPEPLAQVADLPADPEPVAPTAPAIPKQSPIGLAVADDLTKIPGIGPKMSAALAAAGITTYRQLSETDVPTLRAAITAAGLRLAPTVPTWPDRAKQLDEAAR